MRCVDESLDDLCATLAAQMHPLQKLPQSSPPVAEMSEAEGRGAEGASAFSKPSRYL